MAEFAEIETMYGGTGEDLQVPFAATVIGVPGSRHDLSQREEPKRKLAKRANEIYRSLCSQHGLQECFFYGFRAWSDFVEGRMSESTFYEAAKAEAEDVLAKGR